MQWLASKYIGMGFRDVDVRRHGMRAFIAAVETYGLLQNVPCSFTHPGTFLDIPPASIMRVLTHPSLFNRFFTKCALHLFNKLKGKK
jgi:hypothetical protein